MFMNKNALNFGLKSTYFTNPHGLKNMMNKSTASDIAKLCFQALKVEKFQEIVNKKTYKTTL